MTSRKLSVEGLVALGPERLSALILAQAEDDPVFARTVRMALAAKNDASALAHAIDVRLKAIRRSRSFLEWDKLRALTRELDRLRATIAGPLAEQSPTLAIVHMRQFVHLAPSLFERADDSNGTLGDIFREGGDDLGRLWAAAKDQEPRALAAEILSLIEADEYGMFDGLPEAASRALGSEGRATMRRLLLERQASATSETRRKYDYKVRWLLPKLADLDGDVDAYIATVDQGRRNALLNAKVAERLIAHDRAREALEWIDAPTEIGHNGRELADLRLRALERLGDKPAAQMQRRQIFERWLDREALRAWLRNLPDFEDEDAEQAALAHVAAHADATSALAFLVAWPDHARTDRLIRARHDELNGRNYVILRPAAEALYGRYPAAASLLYRRLVDGALDSASFKNYPYAARDLKAAAALAEAIPGNAEIPSHEQWTLSLRERHGRKAGFWSIAEGWNAR